MIGDNDLAVLINHRDAVAALQGYYVRLWDKVMQELALGIAKPGALRLAQLLAEFRYLLRQLDPDGNTYVARWVRAWAAQAMNLGQKVAKTQIAAQADDAPEDVPAPERVGGASPLAAATLQDAIEGDLKTRLRLLQAQMLSSLDFSVHRIQYLFNTDPDLADPATRAEVGQDLSDLILQRARPLAIKRLRQNGLPGNLIDTFDRMGQGQVYTAGTRTFTIESKIGEVAGDMIADGHSAAVKATAQANGIDHVRISNPPRVGPPDVCTVFAGHVFYIGAGEDPLGFPNLVTVPNGGPKFHPHCRHSLQPYVVRLKSQKEIASALAAVDEIPKDFFGFDVKPYDVTKAVNKMPASKVNPGARAPRSEKVA